MIFFQRFQINLSCCHYGALLEEFYEIYEVNLFWNRAVTLKDVESKAL